jgi:CheY-like chemotaxis protein
MESRWRNRVRKPVAATIPFRRVLIVEGDEDTRDLYQAVLVPQGYAVEHAANGREALAQAIRNPPDIIVMETHIQGVDGFCLCELLRADRGTSTVPIVVLTADARPTSLDRARRAGADAVLTKPCLPEVLLSEMDRVRQKRTTDGRRRTDGKRSSPGQAGERDYR